MQVFFAIAAVVAVALGVTVVGAMCVWCIVLVVQEIRDMLEELSWA